VIACGEAVGLALTATREGAGRSGARRDETPVLTGI